jgi:hypothetical protein
MLSWPLGRQSGNAQTPSGRVTLNTYAGIPANSGTGQLPFGYADRMNDESGSKTFEERAWQYFLQLQPSIADVNAAAELAFRAVEAFDKGLQRRQRQEP